MTKERELLKTIVAGGCYSTYGMNDLACCYFCSEPFIEGSRKIEERHKPDCPYVVAKVLLSDKQKEVKP